MNYLDKLINDFRELSPHLEDIIEKREEKKEDIEESFINLNDNSHLLLVIAFLIIVYLNLN